MADHAALLDEELRLEEELALERATTSLLGFAVHTMPTYSVNWHHALIAQKLDRFLSGDIRRLMIFLPPRFGKTQLCSIHLPAYALGKNPNERVMAVSYSASLAANNARQVQRLMRDQSYGHLFPKTKLAGGKESASKGYVGRADEFEVVGHRGGYIALGTSGSATGRGASCFIGKTKVSTEDGEVPIQDFYNNPRPPRVWGYNFRTGRRQLCRVVAVSRKRVARVCTVSMSGGGSFTCTPDHLVFDASLGWRQAQHCGGRSLLTSPFLQNTSCENIFLPPMPYSGEQGPHSLQKMLHVLEDSICNFKMPALRPKKSRDLGRVSQKPSKRSSKSVLRHSMFAGPGEFGLCERSTLCGVHEANPVGSWVGQYKWSHLLLSGMPSDGKRTPKETTQSETVQTVHQRFCTGVPPAVLLNEMQKFCPQRADEWKSKPMVCRRKEHSSCFIQSRLSQYASFHFVQRQKSLLLLQRKSLWQSCPRTPHRREKAQQPRIEFDNSVRHLSLANASHEHASPAQITHSSQGSYEVYDLEVETTANFYAEKTLVHNCLILDDLVKSRAEADSQTYRDRIYDWFTGTIYNRLEKDGRCLLVMTRWHTDDAASRLLAHAQANPEADQWEVLSLPAVCEEADKHPDDPRDEGDVLWPAKYNQQRMTAMRATMGARDWLSLYQQRPVPSGGNIVQNHWFRVYRQAELPQRFEKVIISADLTFDGGKKGDWTVALVVGQHQGRAFILDMVRRQMPFTQQVAAIRGLYHATMDKWGVREVIVEKAANGAALVDVLRSQIPCIVAVPTTAASKVARAEAVTPIIEAGNVWLPHEHEVGWVQDFRAEWCAFPQGAHDDIVDSCTYALARLFPPRASMLGAMPMGMGKQPLPSFF